MDMEKSIRHRFQVMTQPFNKRKLSSCWSSLAILSYELISSIGTWSFSNLKDWAAQNPAEFEALKVNPKKLPAQIRSQGERVRELMMEPWPWDWFLCLEFGASQNVYGLLFLGGWFHSRCFQNITTWFTFRSCKSGGHPRTSRDFPTDLANPAADRVRSLTGSCSRPGIATHAHRAFAEHFVARPTEDGRLEKWRVPAADSKRYPRNP